MINYLRKRILAKNYFARQSWTTKKNIHNSDIFRELNLNYRRYGKKNPGKFFYVIRRTPGAGFFLILILLYTICIFAIDLE